MQTFPAPATDQQINDELIAIQLYRQEEHPELAGLTLLELAADELVIRAENIAGQGDAEFKAYHLRMLTLYAKLLINLAVVAS